MAATEFTDGGGTGKWNNAANWDNGIPGAGDDATIPAGLTCEMDLDGSGTNIGSVTIAATGHLFHSTDADTCLETTVLDISGTYSQGTSANPISTANTCELILHPAADHTEAAQINVGGTWNVNGSAQFNRAAETWAACQDTLAAQANSGQPDVQVSTAAFANALRSSGDILLLVDADNGNYEEAEVSSKSSTTLTMTGNLTNTYAAGSLIFICNYNVTIRSIDATHRAKIDDNNTTAGCGINWRCVGLKDIDRIEPTTPNMPIHFASFYGTTYAIAIGNGTGFNWSEIVSSGTAYTYSIYTCKGMTMTNFVIAAANTYAIISYAYSLKLNSGYLYGGAYGIHAYAATCNNVAFDDHSSADIYADGDIYCNGCLLGSATEIADQSAYIGASVYSSDHDHTAGAVKIWQVQYCQWQRQSSIKPSGESYAAQATPGTYCSSGTPGTVGGEIDVDDGDTVRITVEGTCDAAYGNTAANKPLLVLDPQNLWGAYDVSTEQCNNNDTGVWTTLEVEASVNLSGASTGKIPWEIQVPYYAAGADAYFGDVKVYKNGILTYEGHCEVWGPKGPMLLAPETEIGEQPVRLPDIVKDTASQKVRVHLRDADGAPVTGVASPTIKLAKGLGGAYATMSDGTWTEVDSTNAPGAYDITFNATDTNTAGVYYLTVDKSGSSRPFRGWGMCETVTDEASKNNVSAIKTVTDNLPNSGQLTDISNAITTITAKLPTNYIMGSSDQTDHDDEISSIKSVTDDLSTEISNAGLVARRGG